MRSLRGKKALITGAAAGIGRAIALALAREGVDLYLLDIDTARLELVVAETTSEGVETIAAHCDVTDPAAISRAVADILEGWGHIDILINNAGVAYYGATENMSAEQWDWVLGINLLAPVQLARELLPTLLERPEAHILNVCSIAGLVAGGRFAAYHVSKFGLVGFSEALRAEYGRRGIGVTALCPGPVQTNMYASAISGKKNKPVPTPPAWLCTSEEKVARAAVKAIKRNRRMVLVTPIAHLLWNAKRFAPWLLDFMNHLGRKRKQRAKELAVKGDEPGNSAEPCESRAA